MPKLAGINHQRVVKAFKKTGFWIARQGKHIAMTNGDRIITIPRANPVDAYTMAGIVRDAGLSIDEFKNLLWKMTSLLWYSIDQQNAPIFSPLLHTLSSKGFFSGEPIVHLEFLLEILNTTRTSSKSCESCLIKSEGNNVPHSTHASDEWNVFNWGAKKQSKSQRQTCPLPEIKPCNPCNPCQKLKEVTFLPASRFKLTDLKLGFLLNWNVTLMKNGIKRMVNNL